MLKAILFDVDGTLVDSNDLHVTAWQRAFAAVGADLDRGAIHHQIGKGGDNLVPALLPGASRSLRERVDEEHGRIFQREMMAAVMPFPGAHDLVARCRDSGLVTVLASSSSRRELDHYIDLLGIAGLLDATTSRDDVERTKPCPDIFETAARKTGVWTAEALVIGDTPYDVMAAGQGGMGALAVRSGGFSDAELADSLGIYDDVADVLAHFDQAVLAAVPA
ncbi:HAD family hydrolase [Sphingomonas ginkgonis]|uniref:HAD family hydrolase n=1 Tax=Sphingomonas ginkgonis TaxID=2315330 RepID=A0A429VAB8_9SPHN|nr:HAD family hydrolase [Sphingomonas ginkgonis]RST30940.1 HAD family hydrolase [Sphingomonas ginkgonis]